MIKRDALSQILEENLEARLNKVLNKQGYATDSTRILFRFISSIYKQLPPELITWSFKVILPIDKYSIEGKNIVHMNNFKDIFHNECTVVMVSGTTCIFEAFDAPFNGLAHIAYIYRSPLNEQLYIGDDEIPISDYYDSATCSIFSYPVYKELDEAMNSNDRNLARNSICCILKSVWADATRKEFCEKPEHFMRDSLWQYLNSVLRTHTVKREQNVDETHPVDIKIIWPIISNVALIEVKWLGDSGKTHYRDARANEGAKQLIDYLYSSYSEEPDKNFIGYLTVFDGRRDKDILNHYANIEIDYKEEYRLHPSMRYHRIYLAENN